MQMYLGSRLTGPQQGTAAPASQLHLLPPPQAQGGAQLGVAGGELVAAMKFDGYITPQNAEQARQRLIAALKTGGLVSGCSHDSWGLSWWLAEAGLTRGSHKPPCVCVCVT